MCGIAGATHADHQALMAMVGRLHHRGPDDSGIWIDERAGLGLGHARLAVIDLSPLGHQPMASDCGRYVIAFNGEIYNFRELRAELEAVGETFRSHSDTEILLCLLRREGAGALTRLAGMFAFALWDRDRRELLLARDRFGVKPLVYAPLAGGQLAFASEIRALASYPGVDLGRDTQALSEYLALLYVPAPRTLFAGIAKLPPGSLLRWKDGAFTIERWWRPSYSGDRTMGFEQAVEEVTPLVRRAVRDRLVSDVTVGCFLSGGIDSSVIAAL
ncbi:MAG: asparagine synthase (glutamine-hydrolyzing), partial [Magnetospirillum sp.]|nr:asparagine synthase (glutamine-hydrolyzing) [Magnetospirillum sp.]